MNDVCTRFDDLIEQTDEEGLAELETHAGECRSCRARLESWHELSRLAKDLHASWESPELWRRIEDGIEQQKELGKGTVGVPGPMWKAGSLLQVAALLVVVVGMGVFLVRGLARRTPADSQQARWEQWVIAESAIEEVERNEALHLAAIERLESLAEPGLAAAETPLLISYREKLMLLDEAIAECKSQIDENQYNTHLRRQLLAMYSEKDRTLREVLEENHEQ